MKPGALFPLLALAAAFCASSCGGSSSSSVHFHSGTHKNDGTGHQHEGGVVIIIVDGNPVDDMAAFYVTIKEITLGRGAGEPVRVYRSPTGYRVELLSLRRRGDLRLFEVLAVDRTLPEGSYDRIELRIDTPEIVSNRGEPVDPAAVELEGDGKITLAPDPPFDVLPGEPLTIRLDFDVARSISATPVGRWTVRPAVFAETTEGEGRHDRSAARSSRACERDQRIERVRDGARRRSRDGRRHPR